MSATNYKTSPDIPDKLLSHYMKQGVIAVDTELHGLRLLRDEICLVQLCDDQSTVCLVKPESEITTPNLKKLMEAPQVLKIFHFALTDVAFFKTSLGIDVAPFCCTKVMSKLVRTYTDFHGLKDLVAELLDIKIEKQQQQTDWSRTDLNSKQLKYAAHDVLHLIEVYQHLQEMLKRRNQLATGGSLEDLNSKAQAVLPTLVELLVNGYGDLDDGWETSLFTH
ncbi:MAG: 3'-5' exonuclease [SAR324 cluster bacterium]|nr:3'-5' exonuclease [SAR324 cluster bacterium]